MTRDDVRELADEVLKPILGPVGFTSSDVEERENHAGEDAFFVNVHFAPGSTIADGEVYIDATSEVRAALQARGEGRFPYLLWTYPEDPNDYGPDDEDDGG